MSGFDRAHAPAWIRIPSRSCGRTRSVQRFGSHAGAWDGPGRVNNALLVHRSPSGPLPGAGWPQMHKLRLPRYSTGSLAHSSRPDGFVSASGMSFSGTSGPDAGRRGPVARYTEKARRTTTRALETIGSAIIVTSGRHGLFNRCLHISLRHYAAAWRCRQSTYVG